MSLDRQSLGIKTNFSAIGQVAITTTQTSVTNSTTYVNVEELCLPLKVNRKYFMRVALSTTGNTPENLKVRFIVPTGTTMNWAQIGFGDGKTASQEILKTLNGQEPKLDLSGVISVGDTKGDIQLQFAPRTSGSNAVSVNADSLLILNLLPDNG